jgi:hypothetical protein
VESVYRQGISDMYQGELLGEALFSRAAALARDDGQRFKLCVLLQLETETKARLRPLVARLGLSLVEDESFRAEGLRLGGELGVLPWTEFLKTLGRELELYVTQYQSIADLAPPSDRQIALSMVDHERALLAFVRAELSVAGSGRSLDAVNALLLNPLPTAG